MSRSTKRSKEDMLAWLDAHAFDPPLNDARVPSDLKRDVRYTRESLHNRPGYDSFSVLSYFWSAQAQANGKRVWRRLQQYGYPGFEGLAADFAAFCGETPWKRS